MRRSNNRFSGGPLRGPPLNRSVGRHIVACAAVTRAGKTTEPRTGPPPPLGAGRFRGTAAVSCGSTVA
jgi:hypothetical protein